MINLDLFRILRIDIKNNLSNTELYELIKKSMRIGVNELNSISFLKWRYIC